MMNKKGLEGSLCGLNEVLLVTGNLPAGTNQNSEERAVDDPAEI
jgi:hypothetical protein